jgi:hypothetical protein
MSPTSGRFSFISQDSRDRILMLKDKQISNALGLDWKHLRYPVQRSDNVIKID